MDVMDIKKGLLNFFKLDQKRNRIILCVIIIVIILAIIIGISSRNKRKNITPDQADSQTTKQSTISTTEPTTKTPTTAAPTTAAPTTAAPTTAAPTTAAPTTAAPTTAAPTTAAPTTVAPTTAAPTTAAPTTTEPQTTTPPTTKPSKSVYYSSNNEDEVNNGNSGIYAYKSRGTSYENYRIINFDEGCVYSFLHGDGNTDCDRLKIDSGTLNDVVIYTYHMDGAEWSYGIHFKYKSSPSKVIEEDNDGFEYEFLPADLNDALRYLSQKTIHDY